MLRLVRRFLPVTTTYHGQRFFRESRWEEGARCGASPHRSSSCSSSRRLTDLVRGRLDPGDLCHHAEIRSSSTRRTSWPSWVRASTLLGRDHPQVPLPAARAQRGAGLHRREDALADTTTFRLPSRSGDRAGPSLVAGSLMWPKRVEEQAPMTYPLHLDRVAGVSAYGGVSVPGAAYVVTVAGGETARRGVARSRSEHAHRAVSYAGPGSRSRTRAP